MEDPPFLYRLTSAMDDFTRKQYSDRHLSQLRTLNTQNGHLEAKTILIMERDL